VARANVEPGSLQLRPTLPAEGPLDPTGPAPSRPHPVLALCWQTWQQGSPTGAGQRWELLAAVSPPPSSAEGLAGVRFGCPGPACPRGPACPIADPPWGRAGSPGSAGEGFLPGWRPGPGASRATGQPGRQPAGMPHCLACRQLPAAVPSPRLRCGNADPSPSPGVTLGHRGVKCPFLGLAPSRAGSRHESQRIPAETLQFQEPSSEPKTPTRVPVHTHSC